MLLGMQWASRLWCRRYLEEDEEEAFMQTAADLGHTFKGGEGMGTLRGQTEDKALVVSGKACFPWQSFMVHSSTGSKLHCCASGEWKGVLSLAKLHGA
eukprot:1154567-Pelagomonas_calceolata.AAC.1